MIDWDFRCALPNDPKSAPREPAERLPKRPGQTEVTGYLELHTAVVRGDRCQGRQGGHGLRQTPVPGRQPGQAVSPLRPQGGLLRRRAGEPGRGAHAHRLLPRAGAGSGGGLRDRNTDRNTTHVSFFTVPSGQSWRVVVIRPAEHHPVIHPPIRAGPSDTERHVRSEPPTNRMQPNQSLGPGDTLR